MDISVEKMAELARLELSAEEKEKLRKDLGAILEYVKMLDGLDTESVTPTSHVLDLENVFRPDDPRPSEVRDDVLSQAPDHDGLFFRVPKIVDK